VGDVVSSDELVEESSDSGGLRPGTHLGRYELLVPIARGGMARVWAARQHGQRGFQKLVAIKTILPHLNDEPEFERMFLDEARIASGVHHPNVCEIYELGEERQTLYLAMEWVSGESLSRLARAPSRAAPGSSPSKSQSPTSDPLDCRVASRILADACAGAHAAHELADEDGRELGVVHRDLSPHNILLSADGVVKVCDFGVAKALGQLHEATSAGQLKGKIAYMSPEQITGGALDRRSDVFALGSVLYEVTTGVRPFKGDRDHLILNAIVNGEVEPPSSVVKGYPQELERIVLRALAHQPILRYPTAERMRFALEEFLTKGMLVTQSNVAQVVRARIGEQLERRKERIKQAQSIADQQGWDAAPSDANEHRSGVKESPRSSEKRHAELSREPPLESGCEEITKMMAHPSAFLAEEITSADGPLLTEPQLATDDDPTLHRHGNPSSHRTTDPLVPVATPEPESPAKPELPSSLEQTQTVRAPGAPNLVAEAGPTNVLPTLGTPAPASESYASSSLPVFDRVASHVMGPLPQIPAEPQLVSMRPELLDPPGGAGHYVLAAFIGVLIAVVIGGSGFYFWQKRHAQASINVGSFDDPVATASVSLAAPTVASEVALNITPASATVTIDGRELSRDKLVVPRPIAGQTVTVVARAKDFEDTAVVIDALTNTPLDVRMKPILIDQVVAPSADAPAAAPAASVSAKPRPKPRPKEPTTLPENPY
jgi:eukaryotic-like serine/threonine-protein kinase